MRPMITTHILDTSRGRPAEGVSVKLFIVGNEAPIAIGCTNADGRVAEWSETIKPSAGNYRLEFDVAAYFSGMDETSFYSDIQIACVVLDETEHYHVPFLLNPFGYSTYRVRLWLSNAGNLVH